MKLGYLLCCGESLQQFMSACSVLSSLLNKNKLMPVSALWLRNVRIFLKNIFSQYFFSRPKCWLGLKFLSVWHIFGRMYYFTRCMSIICFPVDGATRALITVSGTRSRESQLHHSGLWLADRPQASYWEKKIPTRALSHRRKSLVDLWIITSRPCGLTLIN